MQSKFQFFDHSFLSIGDRALYEGFEICALRRGICMQSMQGLRYFGDIWAALRPGPGGNRGDFERQSLYPGNHYR